MTKAVQIVTDKDIYDFVWMKMVEQGCKSLMEETDEDGYAYLSDTNAYFGHENTKCAIGFLIKDHLYEPNIEESSVLSGNIIAMLEASNPLWKMSTRSIAMLLTLQTIHDNSSAHVWEDIFTEFATSFDIDGNFIFADMHIRPDVETLWQNAMQNNDAIPYSMIFTIDNDTCVNTYMDELNGKLAEIEEDHDMRSAKNRIAQNIANQPKPLNESIMETVAKSFAMVEA